MTSKIKIEEIVKNGVEERVKNEISKQIIARKNCCLVSYFNF